MGPGAGRDGTEAGPGPDRDGMGPGWDRDWTGAGTGPGLPHSAPSTVPAPQRRCQSLPGQSASGAGPAQPMGAGGGARGGAERRAWRSAAMAELSGGSEAVPVALWPPGEAPPPFQVPARGHREESGAGTRPCAGTPPSAGPSHRQQSGTHSCSGRPVPGPPHPHREEFIPNI